MSVEAALQSGNPREALSELQARVRKEPAVARHRVLLFQLLCVLGQWPRALGQLQVVGELDAEALPMVQTYREALRCEVFRQEVFAGRRAPLLFGEPTPWVALLIEALARDADDPQAAAGLRAEAFERAPANPGSADGRPFAWLADTDGRLGPVIEAIINGRYYWIPCERLSTVQQEAPADLRDVVWMPASLTFTTGGETVALLPARYPGLDAEDDGGLLLGRRTEWRENEHGLVLAAGQRVFATDGDDVALYDLRTLHFDPAAPASA